MDTIPGGGEALVQVTARVAADATGTIVNRAVEWGIHGDPDHANDTATSTVEVMPGAQLVSDLRVALHPHLTRVGQHHTFKVVLVNRGPDPAGNVVLTFTASRPVGIISAHAVHDACTTRLPVRCQLGTVPAGGRVTRSRGFRHE